MHLTNFTARFWAGVDKTAGPDACWPWTRARSDQGYGKINHQKCQLAHVKALMLETGEEPDGRCCLHSCDNPPCCNPAHLRWGTRKDNAVDKVVRKRQSRMGGASHPNAKLTEAQVVEIRRRYVPRHPQHGSEAMAREFGVSATPIRRVVTGKGWAA